MARTKSTESVNRRDDIVEAAARLFHEKGYERATVRDIADAVGVLSGSLFYHFKTKEEMLVEIIRSTVRRFIDAAEKALMERNSPMEKLGTLVYTHVALLLGAARENAIVAYYDGRHLSTEARALVEPEVKAYESIWQGVVEAAVQAGLLKGDPKLVCLLSLGALNSTLVWYRPGGRYSVDELCLRAVQQVMRS